MQFKNSSVEKLKAQENKQYLLFACIIQAIIIYTEIRIAPIGSITITSCLILPSLAFEAKKFIYFK